MKKDKDAFLAPGWLNYNFRGVKKCRLYFWKKTGISIGQNSYLSDNLKIIAPGKIKIGYNSKILNKVILDGRGGITIGDHVQIGFESIILTGSHKFDNKNIPITDQGMEFDHINIKNNIWLGARVMVLKGTIIENDVIVGGMSLASGTLISSNIYGGVPAKIIRKLY